MNKHVNLSSPSVEWEIAAAAAPLIAEEGLEYGVAKKKALKQLGLPARTPLPDNHLVHEQVMDYIQLYLSDSQPQELRALREHACEWMQAIESWQSGCRTYVGGAVWLGSATRHADIRLKVFCEDAKSLYIALLNEGLDVQPLDAGGSEVERGRESWGVRTRCRALGEAVLLFLDLCPSVQERGLRQPDVHGVVQWGDLKALKACCAPAG